MKISKKAYNFILLTVTVLCFQSCTVTRVSNPKQMFPETYRTLGLDSLWSHREGDTTLGMVPYHRFFSDSVLVQLIDEGVANNNDLLMAMKQIEIASLAYDQSKWLNVPVANFNVATAAINRPSDKSAQGQSMQSMGQTYIEDYSSSVSVSWEADIWGKLKNQKQVAQLSYFQTQEAARAVQTRIVALIAQGYYNLLMLDMQLDISQQNLELINETLRIIRVQERLGVATNLSVLQQENARDQLLASIPSIKEAMAIQENGLSVLIGRMPDKIPRTTRLTDIAEFKYQTIGLPIELLNNRPDIRSGELAVMQAVAQTNYSKKLMYPSLNLSAEGGLNSTKFKDWFNLPGSLFGSALGSLTAPLLNKKALKTQYEQSKIGIEQSEINFKNLMLNAVTEVSDALANIKAADQRERITEGLVVRSGKAVEVASKLFRQDMATYLDVIVAQNNKLESELNLAAIKQQKLNAVVNLYRSLGGGWN